ncbi:MAG: MoxR family ATPase [Verrucomicrobiota bacterium]
MTTAATEKIAQLQANIERVLYGKPEAIRTVLVALFSGGHVLIQDVPGVGKTLLARALARSLDCSFQRIQFTADMLPADVVGVSVYDQQSADFVFKRGPIFANIVLADEINRTSPRTQSSLLEGMNDCQVSVDGVTHRLPDPFMVLATQNPYEFEGTYPLPESELDRFFLCVAIGYPAHDDELRILRDYITMDSVENLEPVLDADAVLAIQETAGKVRVDDAVAAYALAIVERTRETPEVDVGISPRGALALYRGAQTRALLEGRDYATPDDVKRMCRPVLLHRLVCRGGADARGDGAAARVLDEILNTLPVPV